MKECKEEGSFNTYLGDTSETERTKEKRSHFEEWVSSLSYLKKLLYLLFL